jgi:hypothetical protein
MRKEDDDEEELFMANWDARADELDDRPSDQNHFQLLSLTEEDRLKEMMKRFRWMHKNENQLIKNVKITDELMPIVLLLDKLRFKNPDMMVAGFAVLDHTHAIDKDRLKTLATYLESGLENNLEKKIDMKPHILRYARLIQQAYSRALQR